MRDPTIVAAIVNVLRQAYGDNIARVLLNDGLSLAALIDTAIAETGYDLAVLMRPSGEARFANVRKLMRLAGEFEDRQKEYGAASWSDGGGSSKGKVKKSDYVPCVSCGKPIHPNRHKDDIPASERGRCLKCRLSEGS